MRTKRLALGLALVIGGGLATHDAVLAQDYRGTQEQQMACTPDVWRLCSSQIPDVGRIVACLRANTPQLSDGCRAVFAGPPPQTLPRGRLAPPPRGRVPSPYDDDDEW
jgi:Cysteine rich repeat